MNNLDDELSVAFERLAEGAPHHPDLAGVTRRAVRRRRAVAGASLAAVAVTGLLLVPARLPFHSQDDANVAVAAQCESTVTRAVLPTWARAGFSDPEPVMPFVTSSSGHVVAILFTGLTAPARPDVSNKVLWVWQDQAAENPGGGGGAADPNGIRITARLEGTGPAVTAGLPSPVGPSTVDLPAPGCWRLTLTWPGGSDTIDLNVVRPDDALLSP